MLIVVGTSLLVYPVAALVDMVPPRTPRVLVNEGSGNNHHFLQTPPIGELIITCAKLFQRGRQDCLQQPTVERQNSTF
jgi:NAD-dependent SIR2 family protein deacetylase